AEQAAVAAAAAADAAAQAQLSGDQLALNSDRTVRAGEVVEGDMVVVGGDLRIDGRVNGDVAVASGDLILGKDAVVSGDAIVTGGKLVNEGGRVFGEMRAVGVGSVVADRVREHTAARHQVRLERPWFEPIGEGIAGLGSTLAFGLLLAGAGAVLVFYARPQLDRVSDAVRGSTWKAGGVGLAANFLAIPLFVLVVVGLAVTIVGIPLLLVVVPLYPVAVAAAAAYGVVAVAHALGERTAEQRGSYESAHRNAYTYLFTGIFILLAPLVASNLLGMTGFLGWLGTLMGIVARIIIWAAATIGVGAVILTRGGSLRNRWPWQRRGAVEEPVFDADADPAGRGAPHG
ncbi:MAG TPA: polymer-forming cytoskeletal protein, partial [Longimicrobiaceae bacterium]|nr:polymer-forming cytoskeletal protein [Longimicrobiaceae bacterium]